MISVLGANGFVGSALISELRRRGIESRGYGRNDSYADVNLGDVVFCIGLTADFRSRPLETAKAHVEELRRLLAVGKPRSVTYLSSARIYYAGGEKTTEETPITVRPEEGDHLYNATKLAGEALCLSTHERNRVVRLSNVYGADVTSQNFLTDVMNQALETGEVVLRSSLDSRKDYVSLESVIDAIISIVTKSQQRIYNVAGGRVVSNGEIIQRLAELTGCAVTVTDNAPSIIYPAIDISRMIHEYGFSPAQLLDDISKLVDLYKEAKRT